MTRAVQHSQHIRVLNDNFRSTFIGGQVVMTRGVSELPIDVKAEALLQVRSFSDFTGDNDPYNEHDFGSFDIAGETFCESACKKGSDAILVQLAHSAPTSLA